MRNLALTVALLLGMWALGTGPALADKPVQTDGAGNETAWANSGCAGIQSGTIKDSAGNTVVLGYDQFGYNYQAHMFNGTYDAYDRVIGNQTDDYADDRLIMKWSDDWLSNADCNGDGKLDRGAPESPGFPYISQGWLTNQVEGDYDSDGDGIQDARYTDFVKIVWVGPCGSYGTPLPGGGYCIWGQYGVIQEVYNDPVGGHHGLQFKAAAPGFGLNDQWTTQ